MQHEIYKYIKGTGKYRNQNVALIMGSIHEDGILITTSKANVVAGDVFDKKRARRITQGRANKYELNGEITFIPKSLINDAIKFEERCVKYFRHTEIINHQYPNQYM